MIGEKEVMQGANSPLQYGRSNFICLNHHLIIKELFSFEVKTAEEVVKAQFELEKNAKYLLGLAITSERDDLLYYRGSQKIQINDRELFPERYESKMLMAGLNVPQDLRMVNLGAVPTGNGKLDIWYTDFDHSETDFSTYRVSVYTYSCTELPNQE